MWGGKFALARSRPRSCELRHSTAGGYDRPPARDGYVTVPDTPGSGMEWNEDAVKRLAM